MRTTRFLFSGKLFDISGKLFDVSGKLFDVSGKLFDISCKLFDVSGKLFDIIRKGLFHFETFLLWSCCFYTLDPQFIAGKNSEKQCI